MAIALVSLALIPFPLFCFPTKFIITIFTILRAFVKIVAERTIAVYKRQKCNLTYLGTVQSTEALCECDHSRQHGSHLCSSDSCGLPDCQSQMPGMNSLWWAPSSLLFPSRRNEQPRSTEYTISSDDNSGRLRYTKDFASNLHRKIQMLLPDTFLFLTHYEISL